MTKTVRQDFEMLQLGQGVLDHDTDTQQFSIGQLLIFCQGVVTTCIVRREDAMVRQLLFHTLIGGIPAGCHLLRYLGSCPGLTEERQVVNRAGYGNTDIPNLAFFVSDDLGLARVSLFLPE